MTVERFYQLMPVRFGGDSEAFAQGSHHLNCRRPGLTPKISYPAPEKYLDMSYLRRAHQELGIAAKR